MISILYYILVLLYSIVCTPLIFISSALAYPFDRHRYVVHCGSRIWSRGALRIVRRWKVDVSGTENIDPKRNYVITFNHQSLADIPQAYLLPPIHFKWVSKQEVTKYPIIGQLLLMQGGVTLRRGSGKAAGELMEKGSRILSEGVSVNIFPEGTRSRDREVHRFKEGAVTLARGNGIPILPCVMDGSRDMFDGWKIAHARLSIRVLPAIEVDEITATDNKTMCEKLQAITAAELRKIREQKSPDTYNKRES